MAIEKLPQNLVLDYRYGPALGGALILGLLLLFPDLTDPIRRFLVPSVAVYTVGAVIIAYVHIILGKRELFRALADKKPFLGVTESVIKKVFIAHVSWFALFVIYNFWRGVL